MLAERGYPPEIHGGDREGAPASDALAFTLCTGPRGCITRKRSAAVGTFAQHGHANFKDRSGWFEWDDTLVIHKDGTAELTTRYKVNYYTGWYLIGCSDGMRVATDLWMQHFRFIFGGATVSLYRQGPIEVSDVDPPCWQHAEAFNATWVLDWIDGHLKSGDGEYYRQD